jgi:hypothetical protein
MEITREGVTTISDDDEQYLPRISGPDTGRFVLNCSSHQIQAELLDAIKKVPGFYDTELCKTLMSIHCGHENYGHCSGVEFRSNGTRAICNRCGNDVHLT